MINGSARRLLVADGTVAGAIVAKTRELAMAAAMTGSVVITATTREPARMPGAVSGTAGQEAVSSKAESIRIQVSSVGVTTTTSASVIALRAAAMMTGRVVVNATAVAIPVAIAS
jgi:hypothetical protein